MHLYACGTYGIEIHASKDYLDAPHHTHTHRHTHEERSMCANNMMAPN